MGQSAQEIYQRTLDVVGQALMSNGFDKVQGRFAYPHVMVTSRTRLSMETEDDVREIFTTFGLGLRQAGATEYKRVALECEFLSEDSIAGHHVTYVRKDGEDLVAPYPSIGRLVKRDGIWMVAETQSAIENSHWPLFIPEVPRAPLPGEDGPAVRLRILQDLMDTISDAFLRGDVKTWLGTIELPFTVVTNIGPQVFATEEDVRADFDQYIHELERNRITDIFRTALGTHSLGPNQMVGIYRTHILRGTEQALPSWQGGVVLHKRDGIWRARSILRGIGHHNWSAVSAGDIQTLKTNPLEEGDT
ncbi:MAG: hypothetical protein AAGM84_12055 [Pseudomonadota bacterium]